MAWRIAWPSTWLAPVQNAQEWQAVGFWETPVAGLDFSTLADMAAGHPGGGRITSQDLLAKPVAIRNMTADRMQGIAFQADASFQILRPGLLHGLAGFMAADMTPGVVLTNSPVPLPVPHGATVYKLDRSARLLLLRLPLEVRSGDLLEVRVAVGSLVGNPLWVWEGRLLRAGLEVGRFAQNALAGFPLSRESLVVLEGA